MVVDEHKYGKLVQLGKNDKDCCTLCNHFCKCVVMAVLGHSLQQMYSLTFMSIFSCLYLISLF